MNNRLIDFDKIYTFDFEATSEEPAIPYMVSIVNVGNIKDKHIYTIEDGDVVEYFLDFVRKSVDRCKFYAHNLNYDYAIIRSWAHFNKDKVKCRFNEFILPSLKKVIKATLKFNSKKIIYLLDSYVLFLSPLATVMKGFTTLEKGETPIFNTIDDVKITDEHIEYCLNDSIGLAIALKKRLAYGGTSLTLASGAKKIWKKMVVDRYTNRVYNLNLFPLLPDTVDKELRSAYKGGYCYLNPMYAEKKLKRKIEVYDVNSMYPDAMLKSMPFGKPRKVNNEVKVTENYLLGVQKFSVKSAYLKEDRIPHISTGGNNRFGSIQYDEKITEYLPIEKRTFFLTLQEFELFKKSYYYEGLEFHGGYLFKSSRELFNEYIEKFWEMKKSDIKAIKTIGKYFLNSLYGKFGENPLKEEISIEFKEDIQKFVKTGEETKPAGYLPVAIFTTSYSRIKLIEAVYTIGYDNFIYSDTDSIHCFKNKNTKKLQIDKEKMGYWKYEYLCKEAKYLRVKRYIQFKDNGDLKIVCAGIPQKYLVPVINTIDDFYEGRPIMTKKVRLKIGGYCFVNTIVKI